MNETIGMKLEGWVCYGMPTEPLTPEVRSEISSYARTFEECQDSPEELAALDDHTLIRVAYGAMAEYARGQM